jgi:hypothetical protein
MTWWESIKQYYIAIGEKYEVDPLLFVGIHVIATPLFAASVAWIIYNKKKNKSLVLPSAVAIFIFNAANVYLILFGKNIPFYIYAFVGSTAIISGYFTYKKIRKKLYLINEVDDSN